MNWEHRLFSIAHLLSTRYFADDQDIGARRDIARRCRASAVPHPPILDRRNLRRPRDASAVSKIRKSNGTTLGDRQSPISNSTSLETMPPTMQIAFSWNGLPQFAARLIRGALDRVGENCIVVGSRPSVPILGMEETLGRPVHWLDASQATNWQALGCGVPDIFVQSGWAYPAFSSLGREVKERGGHVIGLSDANWRGDFRQLFLGALAFRAFYRRHFDAMIVPGRQGKRLMRWFGMPAHLVRGGMLGADPSLFGDGDPLPQRPRTFLFAGQFIARKDVIGLAKAFKRFSRARPEWTLHLCGGGEQIDLIPRCAHHRRGFCSTRTIGRALSSRPILRPSLAL